MTKAKTTRKKDVAVACGKSLFVVERDGEIGRLEIGDFRVVEGLLGEHLFPAFVRAFNGVERLDAMFHLVMLNARHLDAETYPLAFSTRTSAPATSCCMGPSMSATKR